jgi:hypothetical protein
MTIGESGRRKTGRMTILIRTSEIPSAHRHDAWRSIVCDTLGPLDFRSDPATPLRGEIEVGQLGPVKVGRVKTSTPHSAGRAVSQVLPGAVQRILPDQAHDVGPQAIVPELIEFFTIV